MSYSRRDFVKTLFVVTPAVLGASAMRRSLGMGTLPVPHPGLNFVVIGDWGRRGETDQTEVATQMALTAAAAQAKFVLNVGDNFYEDGVASVDDPHWQQSFEQVYHAPALQVPWYNLLGNHDYHDNVPAQLDYARTHPRWVLPARYYSFTQPIDAKTTAEFFCLDTSLFISTYLQFSPTKKNRQQNVLAQQPEKAKQLAWLESQLAASTADWKIVVGHHPVFSSAAYDDKQDEQDMIDTILPILQKHKITAYFNGHDHNLQHLQLGTINFFDSGAGSHHFKVVPKSETKFAVDASGFAAVALTRDAMTVTLIDAHGTDLYHATVPRVG